MFLQYYHFSPQNTTDHGKDYTNHQISFSSSVFFCKGLQSPISKIVNTRQKLLLPGIESLLSAYLHIIFFHPEVYLQHISNGLGCLHQLSIPGIGMSEVEKIL